MPALYPNHDADVSRDKVLQEHIEKLKKVVTPGHKDLKIPRRFQYECPWPSAQVSSLSRLVIRNEIYVCIVYTLFHVKQVQITDQYHI